MPLHAGSHEQGANTLAAAIERAFAGEIMAAKKSPLPANGKEDRGMLFNAIAQGVLDYLRANEDSFTIVLSGLGTPASATLRIQSPSFSAGVSGSGANRKVDVSGSRWPAGQVKLVWEDTGDAGPSFSPSSGAFSGTTQPPQGASGTLRLGARNSLGDAVVVEVVW